MQISSDHTQSSLDFERIAAAIRYINEHFQEQPDLETIAEQVHMSPFHFQRMFKEWAGISPKKFLQYISLNYAKSLLREDPAQSLLEVSFATGLSSSSRLHDLFVKIEGMSPAVYKSGGNQLHIEFDFYPTPFGQVIIANTDVGICYMAFEENWERATSQLQAYFPHAALVMKKNTVQQSALSVFTTDHVPETPIRLHLKGTAFQLKVWEALLKIPMGTVSTYGKLAQSIDQPKAARAVGTAIGSNPVAFLIPCHRVIQSSGHFGGYMWDPARKTALIGWEQAQVHQ
ncbi:Bifunctional transcriptional activator/DNA repair enzyme Ada [compost metagenome]